MPTTRHRRKLKLYVGLVDHEYGSGAYIGLTEEEMYEKAAGYCLEWREDCGDEDDQAELQGLLDRMKWKEAVEYYFAHCTKPESFTTAEDTVTFPDRRS